MNTQEQSNVIHFKKEDNFDQIVLQSDVAVIVDFYADWCGPCVKLGPVLVEKVKGKTNVKLVKINVDDCPDISEKYKVSGIPFVLLFKKGEKVSEFVGFDSAKLDEMINSL